MKLISSLLLSAAGLALSLSASQAQTSGYAKEALLLGQTNSFGTARILGLGGSQMAIGGDLSSAYLNPAGLGIYNRSELSISPAFNFYVNDASYRDQPFLNDDSNFNIGSFGLVFNNRKKDATEGWLGGSFAIAYQRTADFRNRYTYAGTDNENLFIGQLENLFFNDPELNNDYSFVGFDTYLLGDYYTFIDGEEVGFLSLVPPVIASDIVTQQESVRSRGDLSTVSLSYGGNFSDKLYIGAGINFTGVDLSRDRVFSESFDNDLDIDDVRSYQFTENYRLEGDGFNATIGLIARPVPSLRLAASYQTPTFYSLLEVNSLELLVDYEDVLINGDNAVIFEDGIDGTVALDGSRRSDVVSEYNFNLRTPSRFNTGLAYIIGKYGFLSADVEFVNYGKSRLSDDFNSLQFDNEIIRADLTNVVNFRLGAEARYDVFRFRLGYGQEGDPYQNQTQLDRSIERISGGLGLRMKNYFIDLGVMREMQDRYYYPFNGSNDLVKQDASRTRAMLTLGYNF